MEGHMEEGPFPWWFRPSSSVENSNQINITVVNHNNNSSSNNNNNNSSNSNNNNTYNNNSRNNNSNNNMTSSNVQGIQSLKPQVILINPNQQPQNQLPQNPASPQVILLTPNNSSSSDNNNMTSSYVQGIQSSQPQVILINPNQQPQNQLPQNPASPQVILLTPNNSSSSSNNNNMTSSDVQGIQSSQPQVILINPNQQPQNQLPQNPASPQVILLNPTGSAQQQPPPQNNLYQNLTFSHSCSSNGFLTSLDLRPQRSSVRSVNDDLGSQRSGRRSVNGDLGSQRSSTDGRSFNGDLGSGGGFSFNILINPRSQQHQAYSLEEVRGLVCRMAKDPQARCFLEEKIVERNQAFIELIFSEVMKSHDLSDLIVDHNAHHLMQKLVVVLNEDQMTKFILSITNFDRRFLGICDHVYGTYVMQKLLEGSLTPKHKSLLVSTLKNIASILSKTRHGHYVIMHCLGRFSNDFTKDLVEEIIVNSVGLATDKSGCFVLQHCIRHVREGEQKGRLIADIVNDAVILSGDAYGNYVIQNILDTVPEVVNDVIAQLAGSFIALSTSRFGSNVVEKCIKNADEEQSTAIMLEILSHHDVMEIAKNNYGNYVIQAIWRNSLGQPLIRNTLHRLIQSNCFYLRSHMYGRRVVETITGNK